MEKIKNYININLSKKRKPSHELAMSVQEIIDVVGESKKYGFGYWLGIVKRSKKSYTEIMGILKELEGLPSKYNKGAVLTNKLCKKKNTTKC